MSKADRYHSSNNEETASCTNRQTFQRFPGLDEPSTGLEKSISTLLNLALTEPAIL
jgi:hypothetical protein